MELYEAYFMAQQRLDLHDEALKTAVYILQVRAATLDSSDKPLETIFPPNSGMNCGGFDLLCRTLSHRPLSHPSALPCHPFLVIPTGFMSSLQSLLRTPSNTQAELEAVLELCAVLPMLIQIRIRSFHAVALARREDMTDVADLLALWLLVLAHAFLCERTQNNAQVIQSLYPPEATVPAETEARAMLLLRAWEDLFNGILHGTSPRTGPKFCSDLETAVRRRTLQAFLDVAFRMQVILTRQNKHAVMQASTCLFGGWCRTNKVRWP